MTTTHKTPAVFSSLGAGANRDTGATEAPTRREEYLAAAASQYQPRVVTSEMEIADRLSKAAASGALAAAVSADEIPLIVAALERAA